MYCRRLGLYNLTSPGEDGVFTTVSKNVKTGKTTSLSCPRQGRNFNWADVTLEVYGVHGCDQFAAGPMTFSDIKLWDVDMKPIEVSRAHPACFTSFSCLVRCTSFLVSRKRVLERHPQTGREILVRLLSPVKPRAMCLWVPGPRWCELVRGACPPPPGLHAHMRRCPRTSGC